MSMYKVKLHKDEVSGEYYIKIDEIFKDAPEILDKIARYEIITAENGGIQIVFYDKQDNKIKI